MTGLKFAMFADGLRIDADKIVGSGLDGYIVRVNSSTVIKVPKLYGTLYPDGSLRADGENSFHLHDLNTEKEVYRPTARRHTGHR